MSGSRTRTTLGLTAALGALALFAAPAFAQKYPGHYYDGEIVVTPPVYSTGVYGPRGAERAEVRVSTRDLDLRRDYDVDVLESRIRDGARLACDVLDDAVRGGVDEMECRRDAQRNAMREARMMVDYARG